MASKRQRGFRLYRVRTSVIQGSVITDENLLILNTSPGLRYNIGKFLGEMEDLKSVELLEEVKCPDNA